MPIQILGKQITGKEIVIAVISIVVFVVLFYAELNVFNNENEKEPLVNLDNDESNPNHVEVRMQITGIDPVKGDVVIRITKIRILLKAN